jgi:hypothetical protein
MEYTGIASARRREMIHSLCINIELSDINQT